MERDYEILGIYTSSFNDKNTGKAIYFGKMYLAITDEPSNGDLRGRIVKEFSVKPEICSQFEVGDIVNLLFNEFGKVRQVISA